ncbi:MAG: nitroreductase family protein [Elusimicrobia bacterium]|nr:nitroreductase family protein [Elusimicrobiota bacterium]
MARRARERDCAAAAAAVGGQRRTALEFIFARRSVRRFRPEVPRPGEVLALLQAAMSAPTACEMRPWQFIVIRDEKTLGSLRDLIKSGRFPAPLAIAVCGAPRATMPDPAHWLQDCSAAVENMLIAASGLGLGAVWIGVYPMEGLVAEVRRLLAIPAPVTPMALVYVGYPPVHYRSRARCRYEDEKVSYERWQKGRRNWRKDWEKSQRANSAPASAIPVSP